MSPPIKPSAVKRLEAIKHQEIFLSVNVEDINMHKLADCYILLNMEQTQASALDYSVARILGE